MRLFALLSIVATLAALTARAGEARVAVASNFRSTAEALGRAFTAETGYRILLSAGSTGVLHAQITQGAPFDLFLSADQTRPMVLEESGEGVVGSRFTYAIGRLVFVSRDASLILETGPDLAAIGTLSIANPKTAPYGAAAEEYLQKQDAAPGRVAQAQNVAGVLAAVEHGAADAGFTAASLVAGRGLEVWPVPAETHTPLRQDAILLVQGRKNAAARAFLGWLRGETARTIIRDHGYDVD